MKSCLKRRSCVALLAGVVLLTTSVSAEVLYDVIDLGTLGGATVTVPHDKRRAK